MVTLSDMQAEAVRAIVAWYFDESEDAPQEFYLAGFAGAGKTTIAKYAAEEIKSRRGGWLNVEVAAFTGKAAHILRLKGNPSAKTIHGLIYVPVEKDGKTVWVIGKETAPAAGADLIILDEVSMVSGPMADDVRSFGKKMLVLGDPAQLPPVSGVGAFLARDPDFFLSEIHRQAAESPIIRLATMLRQREMPDLGDYGEGVVVAKLTGETAQLVYRDDTQPIVAINRVRHTLNRQIRTRRGYEGETPLKGERLICCRNDRDHAIFNGGLAVLLGDAKRLLDGENMRMSIQMDDLKYPLKGLPVNTALFDQHFNEAVPKPERVAKGIQQFDFGYALTCHKAQGSEFPDVTIVDDAGAFRADQWKWRYTAVTRASERLNLLRR